MYGYYALMAAKIGVSTLRKYSHLITTLQITQMAFGGVSQLFLWYYRALGVKNPETRLSRGQVKILQLSVQF